MVALRFDFMDGGARWPALVSGLIAAEISVDSHPLQTILQSHINDR